LFQYPLVLNEILQRHVGWSVPRLEKIETDSQIPLLPPLHLKIIDLVRIEISSKADNKKENATSIVTIASHNPDVSGSILEHRRYVLVSWLD